MESLQSQTLMESLQSQTLVTNLANKQQSPGMETKKSDDMKDLTFDLSNNITYFLQFPIFIKIDEVVLLVTGILILHH